MGNILGWIATAIFIICYIPQIISSRKGEKLSKWFIGLYFTGNVVALIYSIIIKQPPLQLKYTMEIILVGIINIYVHNLKQPDRKNGLAKKRHNKNKSSVD